MPNGGGHHERVGVCPRCGSPSIRIRRQSHRHLLWRCRSCDGVFRTPEVTDYIIPPGDRGGGYVPAESIRQMERRGRLHEPRGTPHGLGLSFSRKLTAAVAGFLLLGVVGYFIFMAGLGRDGNKPDPRIGPDESHLATDLQSPTPEPGPAESDTLTPSLPATAEAAQANIATAIPTDTPVATPTVYPSPTPESTPSDTPTPSPPATAKAAQISTTTPIPTDTPVGTPTKLPAETQSPTPIPTAMAQISPTPESTTPSVSVLATFENGKWLIHNRLTLATSIVAIVWIDDGIEASEAEAVQELVTLAAFHEMLTASLIDLPWFEDGITETELEGIKYLGYIAYDSEATTRQVAAMPWFVDDITETDAKWGLSTTLRTLHKAAKSLRS